MTSRTHRTPSNDCDDPPADFEIQIGSVDITTWARISPESIAEVRRNAHAVSERLRGEINTIEQRTFKTAKQKVDLVDFRLTVMHIRHSLSDLEIYETRIADYDHMNRAAENIRNILRNYTSTSRAQANLAVVDEIIESLLEDVEYAERRLATAVADLGLLLERRAQ